MAENTSLPTLEKVEAVLKDKFSQADITAYEKHLGQLTLQITKESLLKVLGFLRDNAKMRFKQLIDLFVVDYPEREKRFEVVYLLLSYDYNLRLIVKVETDEDTLVPSVVRLYSAATWYEREAWDLFGVKFDGNNDMRRLLTDYNFVGHPFRKDFPLTGYVEPRYDDEQKRVVYDKVKLPQEFRRFDSLSPWEGMTPERLQDMRSALSKAPLLGDEKAT